MDARAAEALAAAVGHSLPSGLVVALEASERLRAENAELREDNERLRQDHDHLTDQVRMWRRKCLRARLWRGAGPYDR